MKAFRVANFEMQEDPAAASTSEAVAAVAAVAAVDLEDAAAVAALGAQTATLVEEASLDSRQGHPNYQEFRLICWFLGASGLFVVFGIFGRIWNFSATH